MNLLRIDEIFNFEKGVLQSSKCVPGEYDFITASSDWKTHNEYTHDCEALIFAAAASGSLGRTHYVNGKFVSSDLCFIITPKDQDNLPVDLRFYHILFNELKDEIVRNTKAGTSKEAIALGSFGKYQLPYFDIDTQNEIKNRFVNAECLKSNLSNELLSQVDLVKKLRQQLLQDAVQGKLVEQNQKDEPANELLKKIKAEKEKLIAEKKLKKEKELPPIKPEEIPFEIPENWVWCRLGDCITLKSGQDLSPVEYSDSIEEGLPYITGASNMENEEVIINRWTKVPKSIAIEGELLLTCKGAGIGKMAWLKLPKVHIARQIMALNSEQVLLKFIKTVITISIPDYHKKAKSLIPGIDRDTVLTTLFPLPPLTEQNRIVQKLDELMQYCNELEASIKESQTQNEKLLQQVLREALRKEEV